MIQDRILTLIDAICSNFQNAINGGPWHPTTEQVNGSIYEKTFCNFFVNGVSNSLGYRGFIAYGRPMLANEMVNFMTSGGEWLLLGGGDVAAARAKEGVLVIAGAKEDSGHGHVCVIRPGNLVESGRWAKLVPKCANVGKDVYIDKGVNYAFRSEPQYFALKSMLLP